MSFTFKRVAFLLPGLLGLAAGCGGSNLVLPSEGVAAKIVVVSGDKQAGVVGVPLVANIVVRVTDSKDRPVQSQQVSFTPADAGSGQAVPPSATTNADGQASVQWVLGAVAGTQTMVAKAVGNGAPTNLTVSFTATASSSVPSKLEKVAGDAQTAPAGSAVATAPSVKVTDAQGNPVAGVGVTFVAAMGGGSVNPTAAVATNASGIAAVTSWTLGAAAGPNTLTATAAGTGITGNPATFTATGVVGAAAKLGLAVAPSASAGSGVPLPVQPQIQVQDAAGNAVATANIPVAVNVSAGGSLSGGATIVQTNAAGLAVFSGLTITGPAAPYTLLFTTTAGLTGVSAPVTVGAGNPSGSQSSFSISPSSFVAGSSTGSTVTVTARDASGNPIAGAAVAVAVTGTNTVTPTPLAPTDASGQTSGVITSNEAGVKTVTVTINGITVTNPASATLTVLPGVPSLTVSTVSAAPSTLVAGNGTSATVTVTVKDALGNPISGASVTLASAGGAITQPAATTNGSGVTTGSVSYATAGAKTVSATVSGTLSLSQTAAITVNPAPTTVTFNPPSVATSGVAFSVTATVAPNAPAGGTPTGTITVGDGGTDQCAIALPGTSCLLTLNTTGSVTVTAAYGGDVNYQASQKSATVNVSGSATNTSVGSSDANSVFGEAVIFTANVTSGSGTPAGSVTFKDGGTCGSGGTVLDTETLVSGSATSIAISTLSVSGSPHTILACYGGGGSFAASSGSVAQNVARAPTTTSSNVPGGNTVVGEGYAVNFGVTVNAPGSGTPTGTVNVADGTGGTCSASVAAGTCTLTSTSAGAKSVVATYAGNTNFAPDASPGAAHTVDPANTTTTITSVSPEPSNVGSSMQVFFTVAPVPPGAGTPTGQVTVSDGTASCQADATVGSCSFVPASGSPGPITLTASYAGDGNFNSSTSSSFTHTLQ